MDDIWILSLPAFRWFQTDAKSTPRFEHQCHRSGDQMISIGGNDYPMWGEADELERGIGIFNLTSLEWQTNYVADQEYDSPDIVKEWYSNGYVLRYGYRRICDAMLTQCSGLEDVVWENNDVKAFFIESDGTPDILCTWCDVRVLTTPQTPKCPRRETVITATVALFQMTTQRATPTGMMMIPR